jgi:hypothetical protein
MIAVIPAKPIGLSSYAPSVTLQGGSYDARGCNYLFAFGQPRDRAREKARAKRRRLFAQQFLFRTGELLEFVFVDQSRVFRRGKAKRVRETAVQKTVKVVGPRHFFPLIVINTLRPTTRLANLILLKNLACLDPIAQVFPPDRQFACALRICNKSSIACGFWCALWSDGTMSSL